MPTGARSDSVLVDTSAAVALLLVDHEDHAVTFDALGPRHLGLAGQSAFETFSVLTRLPSPLRLTPAAASRLLQVNFPGTRFLSAKAASSLLGRLASYGIAGGAVYDALVAATAVDHGLPLATRDRRAVDVYRSIGAQVELLL